MILQSVSRAGHLESQWGNQVKLRLINTKIKKNAWLCCCRFITSAAAWCGSTFPHRTWGTASKTFTAHDCISHPALLLTDLGSVFSLKWRKQPLLPLSPCCGARSCRGGSVPRRRPTAVCSCRAGQRDYTRAGEEDRTSRARARACVCAHESGVRARGADGDGGGDRGEDGRWGVLSARALVHRDDFKVRLSNERPPPITFYWKFWIQQILKIYQKCQCSNRMRRTPKTGLILHTDKHTT